MRNNDQREHYLTALKNGKVGIFRQETSLEALRAALPEMESGHTEGFFYLPGFEIWFADSLRRVIFDLEDIKSNAASLKVLGKIQAVLVRSIAHLTIDELATEMIEKGIDFIRLSGKEELVALSRFKSPANIFIQGKANELHHLILEFDNRFSCIAPFKKIEVIDGLTNGVNVKFRGSE
ncbi:hypothetical protein [Deinococcus sp. AJ005]|uniref:hypothetical protein n=1 Tax=Deinococcus sp. AJ005 TaxID=2652443 RepID=UPI00125CC7BF|nr:hypothetical protein [Deinococcus sp. AJ005]QFP75758.1 hypothetical protein DAAJ005_04270 [Deinococcus sp. AJ005]